MKLITRMNLIGALGLVVVAGACTTSPSEDRTGKARENVTHEPGSTETGTPGQSGQMGGSGTTVQQETDHLGAVGLIADALGQVALNKEQRAKIEELGKKVVPAERKVMKARGELRKELAEQLRKGKIDEKEFEDEIDEIVDARKEASPVLRGAFEDLHGILDEQQRGELVDAITSRIQQHARDAEGWFDEFARDLRLTEDQKTQVRQILDRAKPALEQERETAKKVFEAFKGEQFSMEQIVPLDEVAKRTRAKARGMVSIAKSLSEILTPEQLGMLADKLEPHEREQQMPGQQPQQPGQQQVPAGQQQQGPSGEQGRQEPVGQSQSDLVIGGARGFRAGYFRGGVTGWGGGFSAGHVTVARGGYAAGYPFVGGYFGPGIW